MPRLNYRIVTVLLLLDFAFAACAPAAVEEPAAPAIEEPAAPAVEFRFATGAPRGAMARRR